MNKEVSKREFAKKQAYGILKSEGIYLPFDSIKQIDSSYQDIYKEIEKENILILRRIKKNDK